MNRTEARWSRIVFWDEDELAELHRREMIREEKSNALAKERKSPIDTWDMAYIDRMDQVHNLAPYWDSMLPVNTRDERMSQFLRGIYTCWKPIFGEAYEEPNMAALHKADKNVFARDIKPNRGNMDRAGSRNLTHGDR